MSEPFADGGEQLADRDRSRVGTVGPQVGGHPICRHSAGVQGQVGGQFDVAGAAVPGRCAGRGQGDRSEDPHPGAGRGRVEPLLQVVVQIGIGGESDGELPGGRGHAGSDIDDAGVLRVDLVDLRHLVGGKAGGDCDGVGSIVSGRQPGVGAYFVDDASVAGRQPGRGCGVTHDVGGRGQLLQLVPGCPAAGIGGGADPVVQRAERVHVLRPRLRVGGCGRRFVRLVGQRQTLDQDLDLIVGQLRGGERHVLPHAAHGPDRDAAARTQANRRLCRHLPCPAGDHHSGGGAGARCGGERVDMPTQVGQVLVVGLLCVDEQHLRVDEGVGVTVVDPRGQGIDSIVTGQGVLGLGQPRLQEPVRLGDGVQMVEPVRVEREQLLAPADQGDGQVVGPQVGGQVGHQMIQEVPGRDLVAAAGDPDRAGAFQIEQVRMAAGDRDGGQGRQRSQLTVSVGSGGRQGRGRRQPPVLPLLGERFRRRDLPIQMQPQTVRAGDSADDIGDLVAVGGHRGHHPQRLIDPGRIVAIGGCPGDLLDPRGPQIGDRCRTTGATAAVPAAAGQQQRGQDAGRGQPTEPGVQQPGRFLLGVGGRRCLLGCGVGRDG